MKKCRIDVSVIISTRNRADLLRQTLQSLRRQKTQGIQWQLVIVDNGSSDETAQILKKTSSQLNMVILHEPVAGKSRALNRALEVASGNFLLFTDDDVIFSPTWIRDLHSAGLQNPSLSLFCGPIIPAFPARTPKWIRSHPFAAVMFGRFEPQSTPGLLARWCNPFGASFAVRACAAAGERFRLDLGPSAENGPFFDEDTEFVGRFVDSEGRKVYIPSAYVFHHIAGPQTKLPWIIERSFHLGRSRALIQNGATLQRSQLELHFLQDSSEAGPRHRYERASILNFYFGQWYQLQKMGKAQLQRACEQVLHELKVWRSKHLLGPSAIENCNGLVHQRFARIRQACNTTPRSRA